MIPALIGAGAALLGGAASHLFSSSEKSADRDFAAQQFHANWVNTFNSQRLQFDYNKALAALQNHYNVEAVNAANAYNSPSAVRARLSAAGMNPDLAYSGSAMTPGAALSSSSGSVSAPVSGSPSLPYGLYSNPVQDSLVAAQISNINADTALKEKNTEGKELDNEILSSTKSFRIAAARNEMDLGAVYIENSKSLGQLTNAQIVEVQKKAELLDKRKEEIDSIVNLNRATSWRVNEEAVALEAKNLYRDEMAAIEYKSALATLHITETEAAYASLRCASMVAKDKAVAEYFHNAAKLAAEEAKIPAHRIAEIDSQALKNTAEAGYITLKANDFETWHNIDHFMQSLATLIGTATDAYNAAADQETIYYDSETVRRTRDNPDHSVRSRHSSGGRRVTRRLPVPRRAVPM